MIGLSSLSNISIGQICLKFFNSTSKLSNIFLATTELVSFKNSFNFSFKNDFQKSVSICCQIIEAGLAKFSNSSFDRTQMPFHLSYLLQNYLQLLPILLRFHQSYIHIHAHHNLQQLTNYLNFLQQIFLRLDQMQIIFLKWLHIKQYYL